MTKAIMKVFQVAIGAIVFSLQSSSASDSDKYRQITNQVFFYGGPSQTASDMLWGSPLKYEAATEELHNLVTDTVLNAVATEHASSETVRTAIDELQGKFTLRDFDDRSNIPFADLREVAGFKTLFVAVSVMRGGLGIPTNVSWLQYYSNKSGTWKLISEERGLYDGSIFCVASLEPGPPDDARYLSWGMAIGDGHAVYKIRGHAFDGQSVRTFYTRNDVSGGSIAVKGNRVSVTYQEKPDSPQTPPRLINEDLESGVSGIRELSHQYVTDYPPKAGQRK